MDGCLWPLWDLRIRVADLELRPDWDEGLRQLAALAADGIHDPGWMPFGVPWSDLAPGGELERSVLQHHWKHRGEWSPDRWCLTLLVLRDGEVIGSQSIESDRFVPTGVVTTGSWLGRRHQGRGAGTRMRAAVLELAFAGLDARQALSGAWWDNEPSLGVSRRLGYAINGERLELRRGQPDRMLHLLLSREAWAASRWPEPIEIEGLDRCRPLFGLPAG